MDFMDMMMDYLEENVGLFAKFKLDILSDDERALSIRLVPSSPTTRFFDHHKDNIISFQVISKHENQRVALQTLYMIEKAIEDLVDLPSKTSSYKFIKCEVYNNPIFVEKTNGNSYIYTMMFNATLHFD